MTQAAPLRMPSRGAPKLAPRVQRDSKAADFVLDEIHALVQRGGATVRENPGRSLHWELPKEAAMASGKYTMRRNIPPASFSLRVASARSSATMSWRSLNGPRRCVPRLWHAAGFLVASACSPSNRSIWLHLAVPWPSTYRGSIGQHWTRAAVARSSAKSAAMLCHRRRCETSFGDPRQWQRIQPKHCLCQSSSCPFHCSSAQGVVPHCARCAALLASRTSGVHRVLLHSSCARVENMRFTVSHAGCQFPYHITIRSHSPHCFGPLAGVIAFFPRLHIGSDFLP